MVLVVIVHAHVWFPSFLPRQPSTGLIQNSGYFDVSILRSLLASCQAVTLVMAVIMVLFRTSVIALMDTYLGWTGAAASHLFIQAVQV